MSKLGEGNSSLLKCETWELFGGEVVLAVNYLFFQVPNYDVSPCRAYPPPTTVRLIDSRCLNVAWQVKIKDKVKGQDAVVVISYGDKITIDEKTAYFNKRLRSQFAWEHRLVCSVKNKTLTMHKIWKGIFCCGTYTYILCKLKVLAVISIDMDQREFFAQKIPF